MCLGIPARIVRVNGDYADADINGTILSIGIQLLDHVNPGDFVLIHAGYALEVLNEKDAHETIRTIKRLEDLNSKDSRTAL